MGSHVDAHQLLIDPRIRWRELGGRRVGAEFTSAGTHDFGRAVVRWSTPLRDYREFEGRWVGARGDGTWDMPSGPLVYGEFELNRIEFNPFS